MFVCLIPLFGSGRSAAGVFGADVLVLVICRPFAFLYEYLYSTLHLSSFNWLVGRRSRKSDKITSFYACRPANTLADVTIRQF